MLHPATVLLSSLVLGLVIAIAFGRQADSHAPSQHHGAHHGGNGHNQEEELRQGHEHAPLPSADNVKLIIVGFRHGNRNPAQFLKNDTTHEEWAWEGASQLTNIGKRQAFSLGKFIRNRYMNLIPAEFSPSKIKAYSSSAERCQMTLQSAMAGLYRPNKGRANWNAALSWQPIPYEISDPLLRMYNVKCPHYTTSYQGISDDNVDAATKWLNKDKELTKYIAQQSGLNASLSDLADVADNIGNMKMMNVPLPNWVIRPTIPGYPPKDMYKAIMGFAEAHQVLCADDAECARMMAGMWLDQVITTLKQKKDGKLTDRAAHFYAAHTETVLSLIRLIKAKDVVDTPTSAGMIIEYTDLPAPAVRFIFHEPDPTNPDVRLAEIKELPYCSGQQWCPLETFIENIKVPAFSDWQAACKLPRCAI
ncbi:putative Testicular acid phosphatase-like protein [Hypsibius exemplaris]|uniref:Testicular acid phosphatase-like protein n=1 Tax=Hypsibius exemplaris TaxID=2072580 RepID=A0A1W0WT86_HYPEX|nr:putative Testicular acid phosphatase-like protein [Hypsibius exemplaris]